MRACEGLYYLIPATIPVRVRSYSIHVFIVLSPATRSFTSRVALVQSSPVKIPRDLRGYVFSLAARKDNKVTPTCQQKGG